MNTTTKARVCVRELRGLQLCAVSPVAVGSRRQSVDEEAAAAAYNDVTHVKTAVPPEAATSPCRRLLPLLRQTASLQVHPERGRGAAGLLL